MHRNIRGLATNMEHVIVMIICQKGNVYCTHHQFRVMLYETDNGYASYGEQFAENKIGFCLC